ncbi:MAG: dihydropteroate synthase [Betaproteobacteria bacterium]
MFNLTHPPLIMGILNVTPDSFSDGGLFSGLQEALIHVEQMIEAGVDIIDIGGESTRPGSDPVTPEEQQNRVIPVITAIRQQLKSAILISIDTTSSTVAKAALDADANIINDVSGGQNDPAILTVAAQANAPIILMHSQGTPKTMQDNPYYEDVVAEVIDSLKGSIEVALQAGIKKENILIDPGIGFGKRKQDNLDLLAHLEHLVALGFPVLLGTSRKRFMGTICAVSEPSELVTATAVTTALGVMAGVQLFRVHDVKENRQAADVAWAIKQRLKKYPDPLEESSELTLDIKRLARSAWLKIRSYRHPCSFSDHH